MKHSYWLRLHSEGENICAILREKGYRCQKQARRLSWWVNKESCNPYVLTYFPSPVGEWSLLPNDDLPEREQLMVVVQSALKSQREKVTTFPLADTATREGVNGEQLDSDEEKVTTEPLIAYDTRPWAIVRLLPDARRYTVAKFANRQDAHDHLRVLNRFMPAAEFEIVFEGASVQ